MNNVYVLDVGKNNWIGSTKEEILSMIEQMFDEGKLPNIDDGFITKIKEINKGYNTSVWIGTRPEYELIPEGDRDPETLYLIVDDSQNDYKTKINEIHDNIIAIDRLNQDTESIYSGLMNGDIEVPIATYAEGTSENANRTIEYRLGNAGETNYYTSGQVYIDTEQEFHELHQPSGELSINVRGHEVICELDIQVGVAQYFTEPITVDCYFKSDNVIKCLPPDPSPKMMLRWTLINTFYYQYDDNYEKTKHYCSDLVEASISKYYDREQQRYIGQIQFTATPPYIVTRVDCSKPYRLHGIAKYETEKEE